MTYEQNYLAHFGIKGQKWGIRRFQNPDGTLTEEGKTRYTKVVDSAKRELSDAHADHVETAKSLQKRYKEDKRYFENKQNSPENKSIQERYLKEQFGNDWKDQINTGWLKNVFDIDDPYKWAKEEMIKERDHHLTRDKQKIEEALKEADVFKKRYDRLSSMKLEDLSKHDVEQLEGFINRHMKNELFFLDDDTRFRLPANSASGKKTLSQRFNSALKDHPKLTYDKIYKDMKVDLDSDDPDVYKEAEDQWLRKHGY